VGTTTVTQSACGRRPRSIQCRFQPMNSIEDRLDTLEAVVDDQQATIESHKETIAAQQATIEAQRERLDAVENDGGVSMPISRRGALTAGGALGLLGLGAGTASAQGSGQIGTGDTPVGTIYTEALSGGITGGNEVGNLVGWGLDVYTDISPNELRVAWGDANALDQTGSISSNHTLRLTTETSENIKSGNIVSGHRFNQIDAGEAAVISGGGGDDTLSNQIGVNGDYGAIGGGKGNLVDGEAATIPGGDNNIASGNYSFAVGREAEVKEEHNGAFVVGDSSEIPIESQNADEARFQMNVVAEDIISNGEITANSDVTAGGDIVAENVISNAEITANSDVTAGENVVANAFELVELRGDSATDELSEGEGMIYISEGMDGDEEEQFGDKGDLVYGYNNSNGDIERVVIAENPHNV